MRNHLNGDGVEIIDISRHGLPHWFLHELNAAHLSEDKVGTSWKSVHGRMLLSKKQKCDIPELNEYSVAGYFYEMPLPRRKHKKFAK